MGKSCKDEAGWERKVGYLYWLIRLPYAAFAAVGNRSATEFDPISAGGAVDVAETGSVHRDTV